MKEDTGPVTVAEDLPGPATKPKLLPGGKDLSLLGMIVAALWVGGFSACKFILQGIATVELSDIIMSGLTVGGCFAPVVLSIWADKLIQLRRP